MADIPETLARAFPEYEFSDLDSDADAELVIERVLEYGTRAEWCWLFSRYGLERIRNFVRRRGYRTLSKRGFAYWRLVLDIEEYQRPPWAETAASLWGR
ncbi:MAG: hypothetical protein AB1566_10135 [Chloroflexota bacterium]